MGTWFSACSVQLGMYLEETWRHLLVPNSGGKEKGADFEPSNYLLTNVCNYVRLHVASY
jgi:hypothetical protein